MHVIVLTLIIIYFCEHQNTEAGVLGREK